MRVLIHGRYDLHGFTNSLPEPLAIRFIAEVLCELVPRDDLSPLTRDPRQTVGEIGVEIERGRDTLELANCHLVQSHGMIYQMAVERLDLKSTRLNSRH